LLLGSLQGVTSWENKRCKKGGVNDLEKLRSVSGAIFSSL
jgi:hypothetical protein